MVCLVLDEAGYEEIAGSARVEHRQGKEQKRNKSKSAIAGHSIRNSLPLTVKICFFISESTWGWPTAVGSLRHIARLFAVCRCSQIAESRTANWENAVGDNGAGSFCLPGLVRWQ